MYKQKILEALVLADKRKLDSKKFQSKDEIALIILADELHILRTAHKQIILTTRVAITALKGIRSTLNADFNTQKEILAAQLDSTIEELEHPFWTLAFD